MQPALDSKTRDRGPSPRTAPRALPHTDEPAEVKGLAGSVSDESPSAAKPGQLKSFDHRRGQREEAGEARVDRGLRRASAESQVADQW